MMGLKMALTLIIKRKALMLKMAVMSLNRSVNPKGGKSYICKCCKLCM